MKFGFILTVVDYISRFVMTIYNFMTQSFSILGTDYSILGLLGGLGLGSLIIYSIVKF